MAQEEGVPPAPATVSAVNIKIPPFWPADLEVWFAQVEAQFATRGITVQKTHFDHVIASLGPEFATEVRDLILKPPADNPYDTLKSQLIRRTAASEQRKLQQLISGEELGDRKPTQLLRRMQQVLGDKLGSADSQSFLRELFLQRLPSNVHMVLALADTSMDLGKLADMADKVMEVATPTVASVADSTHRPDLSPAMAAMAGSSADPSEIRQLCQEVARLASLVESLTNHPTRRSSSRTRRPSSPAPSSQMSSLCWYHAQFGETAQKCRSPCSWELNPPAGR